MRTAFAYGVLLGCLLYAGPAQGAEDWTADWLFKAEPEGAQRLDLPNKAWKDAKRKIVIVDGEVCLREGALEMFACPRKSKEYESVVVVDAVPSEIHKGLVAVGAKPGSPVSFSPKYKAATGTPIKIIVAFVNDQGKRIAVPAQQWIKNTKTGKPMQQTWVFAGSQTRKNDAGENFYLADEGDFICVSNFPTATLDIPVKSSQSNKSLVFECMTNAIPKLKTKVRLVLIPQLETEK